MYDVTTYWISNGNIEDQSTMRFKYRDDAWSEMQDFIDWELQVNKKMPWHVDSNTLLQYFPITNGFVLMQMEEVVA